jgi:hypothetical protein
MKTTKKPNAGEESTGVRHVEHANESQNNNNVDKDTILFGSFYEQFSEHEIAFLLNNLNRRKVFGFKMTADNLKFIEVSAVQNFLSNIEVGQLGQTFADIIKLKLTGKIKIQ